MNTVVLHVETELDPSAAPRVFGYLGGLGHIPVQAALRRDSAEALVMEVRFDSPVQAARQISAKIGQMPFVLNSDLSGGEASGESSDGEQPAPPSGHALGVADGMQHAPAHCESRRARVDVMAMRFAAAQRGYAIRHRSQVCFNA